MEKPHNTNETDTLGYVFFVSQRTWSNSVGKQSIVHQIRT